MADNNIYQFKISLKNIKPKIWRRIQLPGNFTFADLHEAMQHYMGWSDCHLHEFKVKNPITGTKDTIGVPDEDRFGFGLMPEVIPEENIKIARYFVFAKDKATYLYDFGDGWYHDIVLEKIIAPEEDVSYPRCVTGKRACPPEDCGGYAGYEDLLEIIANPQHKEYKSKMEWLAEVYATPFDPEKFDLNSVN
ncbi:uncharacterized protein LOC116336788 [Contarinia nasturtii]|uniref:uncharacterized protein LOC116336788 n=1 Tax=Contarinia nasturtii TaxID=265458 RepID=UPI0012D47F4A|nr:uncharacterized protein LOC116336788 [Contarinia nasturtii]